MMAVSKFSATIHEIDDFYKTFDLEECGQLGDGVSGSVVEVTRKNQPSVPMAVKLFDQSNLDEESKMRWFRREVGIMQNLAHPYVVKCLLAAKTPSQFYLCMPIYGKGCLASVYKSLTAKQVDRVLVQIASALSYLHHRRIYHGDVKLSNILLDDNGNAALGDFGLSRYIPEHLNRIPAYAATATEGYEAPEILNVMSTDRQVDVFKVDAYALGVSVWQMLFRRQPSSGAPYLDMVRETQMGKFFRDCLEILLQPDPEKRGSMTELLDILRRESTHKDYLLQLEQLYPL